MGRYIIRRLLTMPLILLGISIFTFVLIQLAPGDPITIQFGFDPRGRIRKLLRACGKSWV
jgi:ABC-type dipeptide/oligopeptide/nickel transport system permease component